jgi:hypothetical protein
MKCSHWVREADPCVAVHHEIGGGWLVGAPEEGAGCVRGAPDGAPWGARSERVEVEVAVRSEHQAARLPYGWGLVVVGGPEGLDKKAVDEVAEGVNAARWGGSNAVLALGRINICVLQC